MYDKIDKKEQYIWHIVFTLFGGHIAPIETLIEFKNRTTFTQLIRWYEEETVRRLVK